MRTVLLVLALSLFLTACQAADESPAPGPAITAAPAAPEPTVMPVVVEAKATV